MMVVQFTLTVPVQLKIVILLITPPDMVVQSISNWALMALLKIVISLIMPL